MFFEIIHLLSEYQEVIVMSDSIAIFHQDPK